MELYTDYPFEELGDMLGKEAPIRKCQILSYDGNKYCEVLVDGHKDEIKSGYIYLVPGRCGEVPCITHLQLECFHSIPPASERGE